MFKKMLLSLSLVFTLVFISCGPAAENRDVMVNRSNAVADSVANLIKTAMKEAEMPPQNVIKVDTARPASVTAPGTNTVAAPK